MNAENPPITAYMRTFNEERMISAVIDGAFLVAREVIIIDSGSTDKTKEIARAKGAIVIEQAWLGWGKQKGPAEDAATHDWLLDLDADEVVTEEFAKEVTALFREQEPAKKVYRTMLALAPPTGKPWLNFGLQTRHKLYDRRTIRMPKHDSWDQFRIPADMEVGRLKAPILHYAFADIAHLTAKLNRNSSIKVPMKSKRTLAFRITCGLPIYFAQRYLLDQYFRGGVYGFALALIYGHARWLRDVKMWEERAKSDQSSSE